MSTEPLLHIKGLAKHFPIRSGALGTRGVVQAVRDVTLSVAKGETLGLVGESGCGKSTLGRCTLRLIPTTKGEIWFDGVEVSKLGGRDMLPYRRRMQIIFQDPYSSLNPRMSVGAILEEPLRIHFTQDSATREKRVRELLNLVGLPADSYFRYPHEFSGGQRQRIGIARALAVNPEFIVCDEPVSALDVSIQAQIVNLLMQLQKELQLTYLFISHDLRVVQHISQRIAVMYLGEVVEEGPSQIIWKNPKHPYTQALISAVPKVHGAKKERILLSGELPSPSDPPKGCPFHPRCFMAQAQCKIEAPRLKPLTSDSSQSVACLLVD